MGDEEMTFSVVSIQNLLGREMELWNEHMKQNKCPEQWIEASRGVYGELGKSLKQFSQLRNQITPEDSVKENAAEDFIVFRDTLRDRLFDRFTSLFSLFEWPTPNHKLEEPLLPLTILRENKSIKKDLLIHQVVAEESLHIESLDSRLDLFLCLFVYTLRLQYALEESITSIWALEFLFQPILDRFSFHFSSDTKTNQIDKPEWCFSYLGNCISDHAEFLLSYIQPWLNIESSGRSIPDAKNFLIRGLLSRLETKMLRDIPILLMSKQYLYCHTLSECMKFQNLLFDVHNLPPSFSSPLQVFAYNEKLFMSWITIEKHVAKKNLSVLLKATNRWNLFYSAMSDIDELKPTNSAEGVIVLVENMSDRYKLLDNVKDKLEFYEEIQEELLMKYCAAMEQYFAKLADAVSLTPKLIRRLSRVANSANYIVLVLQDWSESLLFLEMQFEREQDDSGAPFDMEEVEGSLFTEPIIKSREVLKKGLFGLCSAITRSFIDLAQVYFDQQNKEETNVIAYDVSPNFCAALFELKESIDCVLAGLASVLYESFWKIFTKELDSALVSSIISGRNRFRQNDAEQLRYNFKVLFSLITPHYPTKETLFGKTRDCIHILVMDVCDLKELKSQLYLLNMEEQKQILEEYRISVLTGRETELILKKRQDVRE